MTFVRLAFALIVVMVPATVTTSTAWATSCSEWRGSCRASILGSQRQGRDPKMCDDAFAKCMKSGQWIGPDTGRNYGPAAKQ